MEPKNLLDYLVLIPEPRVEQTRKHESPDLPFIHLATVIGGAEHWTHVEEYGKADRRWLETLLGLLDGIPSHDTFGRVFAALDPDALNAVPG